MFVCVSFVSLFQENCINVSLRCYILELIMVIEEEEVLDANAECIVDFVDTLPENHLVSPVY